MASRKQLADNLDYYTFGEHDKHIFKGHGGKQRSKREVALHTNRADQNGHSRKICTKLRNTERNQQYARAQRCKKLNSPKKQRVASF